MNSKVRFCLTAVFLLMLGAANQCAAESDTDLFTGIELESVASGFTAPHFLTSPPDDGRRFVVDLVGRIHILDEEGTLREEPFLDVSDRMVSLRESYDERGLLGLAFHPDYAENGRFFVCYSATLREGGPEAWDHTSHLSEFRVSEDLHRADPASERVVLQVDQPQFNHNGGRIEFGPDGLLYIGLGDGGDAGDTGLGHPPLGHGQDVTTLLGSVLRIDVDEEPYGIPADNPLVNKRVPPGVDYSEDNVREEIWAWGIRNIWGMAFDRKTGVLYAADVGQDLWEEVNRMAEPGNYGWNIKEGTHWFDPQDMQRVIEEGPDRGPMGEPLIDPIIEYRNSRGHDEGIGTSVIGGHVYRGEAIAELRGHYVFGDWSSSPGVAAGVLLVAKPPGEEDRQDDTLWPFDVVEEVAPYILGFGEDADGELYVLTSAERGPQGATGEVYKIVRGR